MVRKETKKYYFSVEGETEKWYLDWLQKTINSITESKYNVKLVSYTGKRYDSFRIDRDNPCL